MNNSGDSSEDYSPANLHNNRESGITRFNISEYQFSHTDSHRDFFDVGIVSRETESYSDDASSDDENDFYDSMVPGPLGTRSPDLSVLTPIESEFSSLHLGSSTNVSASSYSSDSVKYRLTCLPQNPAQASTEQSNLIVRTAQPAILDFETENIDPYPSRHNLTAASPERSWIVSVQGAEMLIYNSKAWPLAGLDSCIKRINLLEFLPSDTVYGSTGGIVNHISIENIPVEDGYSKETLILLFDCGVVILITTTTISAGLNYFTAFSLNESPWSLSRYGNYLSIGLNSYRVAVMKLSYSQTEKFVIEGPVMQSMKLSYNVPSVCWRNNILVALCVDGQLFELGSAGEDGFRFFREPRTVRIHKIRAWELVHIPGKDIILDEKDAASRLVLVRSDSVLNRSRVGSLGADSSPCNSRYYSRPLDDDEADQVFTEGCYVVGTSSSIVFLSTKGRLLAVLDNPLDGRGDPFVDRIYLSAYYSPFRVLAFGAPSNGIVIGQVVIDERSRMLVFKPANRLLVFADERQHNLSTGHISACTGMVIEEHTPDTKSSSYFNRQVVLYATFPRERLCLRYIIQNLEPQNFLDSLLGKK
ncbi:hypothetical protein CANCADRAFT_110097 [Tortispora caseinolytica NRRL Y-17796]|uniref:Uncharacterized protein n=1 Tax=Tortispora caseinolytica NRRL Y-17796 TaxID=767744 RepID=A0A1E4TG91_9ASCO|nr:hypothetical protein CANCADRAFT_110097 [Tortispora caseinolytica NRRL Y-17796]